MGREHVENDADAAQYRRPVGELDRERRLEADLTLKEFQLLALMARRPSEVFSRALISEQIWDVNFDSNTNVVDVHIRRLRSKVDDPFERKLIYTVRGMGYMVEER